MKYITHRRFKQNAICGHVNIPAMSICESLGNIIFYNNKPICAIASENAFQYFAINEDNNGMMRGKLTQNIQNILSKNDDKHQERWDKIWSDNICHKYKRKEHNCWIWNFDFFNADIQDLEYIAKLIGAKQK